MNQFLEMQHLPEAGVPPRQIVKAATINNARAFGLESQVGTIQPGRHRRRAHPMLEFVIHDTGAGTHVIRAISRKSTASEGVTLMGYYMRFIGIDERRTDAEQLKAALLAVGPGYDVHLEDNEAIVVHAGATIANFEINVPGDGLFDDEREELLTRVLDAHGDDAAKTRVVATLRGARVIVAAQVLYGTGDSETTLARLDPLWAWLFRNRRGLLQAEGEGYYDEFGLVLAT